MNQPLRIDAHQHLWRYSAAEYGWIDGTMDMLHKDFLPQQLAEVMDSASVDAAIATPARQCMEESRFLLECAHVFPRICGVVGWVPLTESVALDEALEELCSDPLFVGVREIAQGEPAGFLERPAFQRGIERLTQRELAYDILIFADQLQEATCLVDALPMQQFVLDHCAKPRIAEGGRQPWADDLHELAKRPNVVCKLSGMVTEAKWDNWSSETVRPYLDVCIDAFTPARLMAGSDWPVCLLASGYAQWWHVLDEYFEAFSESERAQVFAGTAQAAYRLPELARVA